MPVEQCRLPARVPVNSLGTDRWDLPVAVVVVVVVVVFTLNRHFYPASSVHPVPVLISYPREILIRWSQTVRQRKTKKYK